MKEQGRKIVSLTAYDYPTARIVDDCGIDVTIVGDSMSMAVMGRRNTLSLSIDEMLHDLKVVSSATTRSLVVADMPFGSYRGKVGDALDNALRLIVEGGAGAVKVEGGPQTLARKIEAIIEAGIPLMGHVGLMPQDVLRLGGFRVQGKTAEDRERLIEMAIGLEKLGCFSLIVECVPPSVAADLMAAVSIPTIGIGAGPDCDGQVLVFHDMLGWGTSRFSKTYADLPKIITEAVDAYADEVRGGVYPEECHCYPDPAVAEPPAAH